MNDELVKKKKTVDKFKRWLKDEKKFLKRQWQLHLMIGIVVVYVFIMHYIPMYGVQMAFRNYNPFKGMLESEWVGLYWFKKFLNANNFSLLLKNTVRLSIYSMLAGFPFPIIFALVLNALKSKRYGKIVSYITYLPHYISLVVVLGIFQMLFSPVYGLWGNAFRLFGGQGFPTDFRGTASAFPHIYVWTGVWQGFGWGSILYSAALSSVSPELHDAARVDGASRFKRIFCVDIPAITPIIGIQLISLMGGILGVGYEKIILMQTNMNMGVSEVISSYVYNYALFNFENFSYGAAIGLFNTVVSVTLMAITNKITNKLSDGEVGLW